jgi:hypothetical protein
MVLRLKGKTNVTKAGRSRAERDKRRRCWALVEDCDLGDGSRDYGWVMDLYPEEEQHYRSELYGRAVVLLAVFSDVQEAYDAVWREMRQRCNEWNVERRNPV